MASVHKRKESKFWWGSFWFEGKKIFRSTGQVEKAMALQVAIAWEEAVKGPIESEDQARRVMADLLERVLGKGRGRMSCGDFVARWSAALHGTVEKRTLDTYESVVGEFVDFVGRERSVDAISQEDVVRWRAAELKRVMPKTVNNRVKILRSMLRQAVAEGFARVNAAEGLKPVKEASAKVRRPFSREELAKVLEISDETWRAVVLSGVETGQRFGDIVRMEWRSIVDGMWSFKSGKVDRGMMIPLSAELLGLLQARPRMKGEPRVFPELVAKLRQGDVGPLSKEFADLLHKAGLRTHSPHDSVSKGGKKAELVARTGNRRERQELSFHSLRHTARTWLEEAGQPKAVIDALIGHEGTTGRIYTTVGAEALREAAGALQQARLRSA